MASLDIDLHNKHFIGNHDIFPRTDHRCEPADPATTVTNRLNKLLQNGGDGYVLRLCPNQVYSIQAPISFSHPNQEISTLGYPTGDDRAVLSVSGPISDGEGHTTAVSGTCSTCNGVKLRNVQVNGMRGESSVVKGGGNIEMGGSNSGQLIEHVRSYDPRGWTCLHISEGALSCNSVIVQNNDIGPCGSDDFQEWADGLSISCRNSVIKNNMIQDPTDGGIVLFGSPGTRVFNNTIWVVNRTLLGGINMVDYDPWDGDFRGTSVHNNTIMGGSVTGGPDEELRDSNTQSVIIKIAIAIGPRTWFGNKYRNRTVKNGIVRQNRLSGTFSYGIAVSSAENFVVQSNVLFGNTSFISTRGPNCKTESVVPASTPFVVNFNTIKNVTLQSNFVNISDCDSLTCVLPPYEGDFWPFGLNSLNSSTHFRGPKLIDTLNTHYSISSTAVPVAVIISLLTAAIFIWRLVLSRSENAESFNATEKESYTKQL